MMNKYVILIALFQLLNYYGISGLIDGIYVTRVDHFTPQDYRKVEFKYKLNTNYYVDGGPLFFYINNGREFTTEWIESGLMVDIAIALGGALFTSDHRYFGENRLTETISFDDLQYLTLEQSISDVATFIHVARQHIGNPNAKIVLWGSGYGGTLAAYTRQKYPHLVDVAWSSSGIYIPYVYTQYFYDLLSNNIITYGGITCGTRIANTFNIMQYYIDIGLTEYLENILNVCEPINVTSNYDVARFFGGQINFISSYLQQNHIHGFHSFCRHMNAIFPDPLNSYARWVRHIHSDDTNCFDFNFDNHINRTSNINWNEIEAIHSGDRQWIYYQCTQLGLMKTSSLIDIFTNSITYDYVFRICEEVLGDQYQSYRLYRGVAQILSHFGTRASATKTIFTNGLLDPWIHAGITDIDDDLDSEVINISYYSTSADLTVPNGWETQELINAKNRIRELIVQWLNET